MAYFCLWPENTEFEICNRTVWHCLLVTIKKVVFKETNMLFVSQMKLHFSLQKILNICSAPQWDCSGNLYSYWHQLLLQFIYLQVFIDGVNSG